eukprot:scaffold6337_cov144-Skeletonema_menzelii.AAC.6
MSKNTSPYHAAGTLLNTYLQHRNRGLKSIAFDSGDKNVPSSSSYATVAKTIQHLPAINSILNANNKKLSKAIDFDSFKNKGLGYVMIYELLFSKFQKIRGGGLIKRMIVKHEKELRREADEYTSKNPSIGDLSSNFPRYVRVNVMHSKVADAADILQEELTKNSSQDDTIYADAHVPDLLVLPPNASSWLHQESDLVKSGKIILQDKSSCFSALVCASSSDFRGDYIDACSAPGNKTSHLAALLHASFIAADEDEPPKKKKKKKGKASKIQSTVFAFERSSARFDTLKSRMDQLVSSSSVAVEPIHGDFLKIDPSDPKYANVRAIMLDPSCSGSGIVNAPDRSTTQNSDERNRIQTLANFQTVALKHSMSFPQVERIVYSTCSVHDEENEMVVSNALAEMNNSVTEDGSEWKLVAPHCLQNWPRRGKEGVGGLSKSQADCLIRCDGLDGDETNGFFVSYFERARVSKDATSSQSSEETCNATLEIPLYNGQYKNIETEVPSNQAEEGKRKVAKSKNTTPTTDKAAEISAKKRAKKLAWKRKQALQKEERLKKRKETGNNDKED